MLKGKSTQCLTSMRLMLMAEDGKTTKKHQSTASGLMIFESIFMMCFFLGHATRRKCTATYSQGLPKRGLIPWCLEVQNAGKKMMSGYQYLVPFGEHQNIAWDRLPPKKMLVLLRNLSPFPNDLIGSAEGFWYPAWHVLCALCV